MAIEPQPEPIGVSRTRGSILLVAARGLNAAFNIVSVPIYLAVLGKEGYAAIVFALLIHSLMSLSDIGTGDIVQRQMSVAVAKKDEAEVRALNRDQVSINVLTGLLMILVGLVCGLLISLEDAGVGRAETLFIFSALGIQSAFYRINQSVSTVLSAYQRFDAISVSSALGGITTTLVAVGSIYLTGRAWTYMAAMLVGETVIFWVLYRNEKKIGHWSALRLKFDKARLKPILRLCAIDYPNRAAAFFASMGDKFMLGVANAKIELVDYRNAARVPDALRDMLQPLASTSLPRLSRDFAGAKDQFQASVLRTGRMVFFAATVLMLAPTGFAEPLLQVWLGKNAPVGGATIMTLAAVYQAFQLYLSAMGIAFFAAAKRQYFIPLTFTNAAVAVGLTLPVFRAYGIVGIAWMNFSLSFMLACGLWLLLSRLGFSFRALLLHALQILAILGLAMAVVGLGRWVSSTPFVAGAPSWFFLFAPMAMLLAMGLGLGLRIAELPTGLASRLSRPSQNGKSG